MAKNTKQRQAIRPAGAVSAGRWELIRSTAARLECELRVVTGLCAALHALNVPRLEEAESDLDRAGRATDGDGTANNYSRYCEMKARTNDLRGLVAMLAAAEKAASEAHSWARHQVRQTSHGGAK